MKKVILILMAVFLSMAAAARTMEVYVNIPQNTTVHCMNADVE